MSDESRRDRGTVDTLEDIPDFATPADERAFWATHRPSADLYNQVPAGSEDDELGLWVSMAPPVAARVRLRWDLE